MKIKLEKKVASEESIEIETPAYFKNSIGHHYCISENGFMKISGGGYIFITNKDDMNAERDLQDHLSGTYDPEEITESEFNDAYIAFIQKIHQITGVAPVEI